MNKILALLSQSTREKLEHFPSIKSRIISDLAKIEAEAIAEAESVYNAQQLENKKTEPVPKKNKPVQYSVKTEDKVNKLDPNFKTEYKVGSTEKANTLVSSPLYEGYLNSSEGLFDFGFDRLNKLPTLDTESVVHETSTMATPIRIKVNPNPYSGLPMSGNGGLGSLTPIHKPIDIDPSMVGKSSQFNPSKKVTPTVTSIPPQPKGIKDFFDNVKAFDVETTKLNTNVDLPAEMKGQIWQVGLAGKGVNQGKGIEAEINPFYIFKKDENGNLVNTGSPNTSMDEYEFRQRLTLENGEFSKRAYQQGNFNNLIDKYMGKGSLHSLDDSIKNTLGTLSSSDVVVLQNMNFENNMLKSAYLDGLISPDTLSNVQDRMETLSEHPTLSGVLTDVFQRPVEVQQEMRQAERLFHKEFLINHQNTFFDQYLGHVNRAMDSYESLINNPNRKGAVALELMDVSKAFYANAAQSGYIEKGTSQLGLNIEFLSQSLGMGAEEHTALSDSNRTIDIFNKLWSMTKEIRSGSVSKETEDILKVIKSNQAAEVNRKFYSSVSSTLNDFKERGYTKRSSVLQWYLPEVKLNSKTSKTTTTLVKENIGNAGHQQDLHIALNDILENYKVFEENILGVNRKEYIDNILDNFNGSNYRKLHKEADKILFNYKPEIPKEEQPIRVSIPKAQSTFWSEETSLLGKEMKRSTKYGLVGGALLGLGYMYSKSTPPPKQKPDDNTNVSYQFYDEQYLGTAFVDFRERNKHYMM